MRQDSMASNRPMSDSESMARDIKEGRLSGFVGNGTVLTGETNFQAMLRVDGHLTGKVGSDGGTLIIGSTGRVDANIHVGTAMVNGTINGDIVATEKVELGRTARVLGNIHSPKLTIEEGAIFEGSCSMLKAKEASDQRIADAQSRLQTNELTPIASPFEASSDSSDALSLDDDDDDDDDEEKADAATL
jgi:cytoskeletal protein CcmA (bactofilin family)